MFENVADTSRIRRSDPFRPDPWQRDDQFVPFGYRKLATVFATLLLGIVWTVQFFFLFSNPLARITCVILLASGLFVAWRSQRQSTWHALTIGFLSASLTAMQYTP